MRFTSLTISVRMFNHIPIAVARLQIPEPEFDGRAVENDEIQEPLLAKKLGRPPKASGDASNATTILTQPTQSKKAKK